MNEISTFGAVSGLLIAIFIIIKKGQPFYALVFGALIGALIGGATINNSIIYGIEGAKNMTPIVLRILAAGVLAGVLIGTNAALSISHFILKIFNPKYAILAIILAAFFVTSIGVFVDVTVITLAPIALQTGKQINFSKMGVLLALVGGGKAGNIVSPNPNTIASTDFFSLELLQVIQAGILPAIIGLIATYIITRLLKNKGSLDSFLDCKTDVSDIPDIKTALIAPLSVVFFLACKSLFNFNIDPLIALPLGAIIGVFAMKKQKYFFDYLQIGFNKLSLVSLLLIGTGFLAGIISNSQLQNSLTDVLNYLNLNPVFLAPLAGILMGGATASTTSGTVVGCSVFGNTITDMGINKIAAAAMIHHGATVLDHLPHGSFFHASAGSVGYNVSQRLLLIPYETLIGLAITLTSILVHGF